MKEKIMPPLVLAIIAIVVCGLLVSANYLTKDKIAAAQIEKTSKSLSETFGESEYKEIYPNVILEGINAVYEGDNGKTIYEITVSGYAKDGLHVLIGFDENDSICGIGFLDIAETPGLGSKVKDDESFIEQFMGVSDKDFEFTPITGATYSSNGMKSAVELALKAHNGEDEK